MNRQAYAAPHGIGTSSSQRSAFLRTSCQFTYLIFLLFFFLCIPQFVLGAENRSGFFGAEYASSEDIQIAPLPWSNTFSAKPPKFYFPNPTRPYMRRLIETYQLASMTEDAKSDLERIKIICAWVHRQWEHKGDCPVQKNDPIAIIESAKLGNRFSCYEYSLVTSGCLNALGIKTRIIVLLPQNVERRPNGNYHVVAEAFLIDRKKWVMIDTQWNAIPILNNYPLSVVELQNVIGRGLPGVDYGDIKDGISETYEYSLAVYLHYFYTPLDNRVIGAAAPGNVTGGVMLVPIGEKPPASCAQAPIKDFVVTHSIPDFYGSVSK